MNDTPTTEPNPITTKAETVTKIRLTIEVTGHTPEMKKLRFLLGNIAPNHTDIFRDGTNEIIYVEEVIDRLVHDSRPF